MLALMYKSEDGAPVEDTDRKTGREREKRNPEKERQILGKERQSERK